MLKTEGTYLLRHLKKCDYQATREFFNRSLIKPFKSDFDPELNKVEFEGVPDGIAINRIISLVENYSVNEIEMPIEYPFGGFGINSNSWAQTIIELAGGRAKSNMNGLDLSYQRRIERRYFDVPHL